MAVSVGLGSGRAPQQLRKGPASHRAAAARRRTTAEIVSKRDMIVRRASWISKVSEMDQFARHVGHESFEPSLPRASLPALILRALLHGFRGVSMQPTAASILQSAFLPIVPG